MGIAVAAVAGLGLVLTSALAHAGAPAEMSPSQVPVVSDDEAGWDQQRPPAYLGVGTSVSHDAHTNADVFLEGGMRVATTLLWVHGLVGTGSETQIGAQDKFIEARGGLEISCGTKRGVCGFFGFDVGGQLETRKTDSSGDHLQGLVAVPRIGLDVGGDTVRLRASFDGRWFRYSSKHDPRGGTSAGAGVTVALGFRF